MHSNPVPYFSQYDASIPVEWQSRSCGVAALYMALMTVVPGHLPKPVQLIEEGVAGGAYHSGIGWRHDGLVTLAKKYGSRAYRAEFRKDSERESGVQKIKEVIQAGGVPIVSVTVPGMSDTHLVPLVGYTDDEFIYHEPAKKSEHAKVRHVSMSNTEFVARWRGLVIFVEPKDR